MIRAGLLVALGFVVVSLASESSAQPNVVAGRDVQLASLNSLSALGRTGTFPNGVSGVAESTTACNPGTVNIPWFAAMNPSHPFIAFVLARESNGRLEQISDRSYVKHGFFATNSGFCGGCQNPGGGGTLLGINCSDTYNTSTNGDNYWLGPPAEIDPWRGDWQPVCSHFDRGEPAVAPPADCDGSRSLTQTQASALGPVGHRVQVADADFNVSGATYYFQGYYVLNGESEAVRGDNIGSRVFQPSWNGLKWVLSVPAAGNPLVYGSVLERWSGATVASATNGVDDGRVYVAVAVMGPTNGLYHYEYAVHDRDNLRGVASFRVPVCPSATVANVGFRDVDGDPSNDWTALVSGGEIAWSAGSNPLLWNTIFNFWFDSDAVPLASNVTLDAWAAGPGAPSIVVAASAPLEVSNVQLGPGCGNPVPPVLFATGAPPKATLGNLSFGVGVAGTEPNATSVVLASLLDGTIPLSPACFLYMDPAFVLPIGTIVSDGSGTGTFPFPIPANPNYEGIHVNFQVVEIQPGGGALLGAYDFTNGLEVRVGDSISACP
jgi:hypothetical protein